MTVTRKMNKLIIFIVFLQLSSVFSASVKKKRVCVIGAGIAGLTSARYLKEEGIDFTVFEATRYVGGTWRYDPHVGTDENGLPLYTSMYEDLRTNLPKPAMELRGFPMSKTIPSFPSWQEYYQYLQNYAKHFDLLQHIQFLHNVISVRRENNKWKVAHQHAQTGDVFQEDYDYVIIGNGHYSKANTPNIPGENLFKGTIIHSHDYKTPKPYTNRRVLIVGAGPSGMDIGLNVAKVSRVLIHSHHSKADFNISYASKYVRKPDVKAFNETGAIFVDGTFEELDDVLYCTGYQYDFPFLDESSGLKIKPKCVTPLYKYMVNIKQPTMFLMGLVFSVCSVVASDAQARYVAAQIKGNFTLPSQAVMMHEWETQMNEISSRNLSTSFIHFIGSKEDEYYADLSAESGIDRVPPVLSKIRTFIQEIKLENYNTFRNYEFSVTDYGFTSKLENNTREISCIR